jgi:glycosyl transferase family 87
LKILAPALLAIFALVFLTRVAVPSAEQLSSGYLSYYVAAQTLRSGEPGKRLYDDHWFAQHAMRLSDGRITDIYLANPPTVAVAWLPFSYLSVHDARKVWIAISVAFLGISFWLIAVQLTWTGTPWLLTGMCAIFLLGAPTREQFHTGQMYALILLLHVIGWRAYIRQRYSTTGLALGLAIVLKISGWPVGLLVIGRRRWSALWWAAGTAAAVALLTLPWVGVEAWRALLLEAIPRTLRWGTATLTAYQDTTGFWQHLFRYDAALNPHPLADAPVIATLLTLATAAGACYALLKSRRTGAVTFAAAVALTELLSPAAEQYHYVVLLLPLAVLCQAAWARRSMTLGAIALVATYLITGPIDYKSAHPTWDILHNYPRLLGGWILFVALLMPQRAEPAPGADAAWTQAHTEPMPAAREPSVS